MHDHANIDDSGTVLNSTTISELSLLLVDDDTELSAMMTKFFRARQIRLESAHDGMRGLARAFAGEYDLILLDVMMPGIDGFEVLRQLRKRSAVPVIMLTARTAQHDRIAGLDAGADDYLPKPFGPEELLARIRAVLRRTGRIPTSESLEAGDLSLNLAAREARLKGELLGLTSFEFDLLEHLVRGAGRVVTRAELTAVFHQRRASPFDRTFDVHIHNLRKKLGKDSKCIRTIRGIGFQFGVGEADKDEAV